MEHLPSEECPLNCVMHRNISEIHDVHLLRHVERLNGIFHGWFLHIWKYLCAVPWDLGQSFEKMWKCQPCSKLEKVSLHGNKRNYTRIWSLKRRPRGGPTKHRSDWEVTTTNHCQGSQEFPMPWWILQKVYKEFLKNYKTTLQFVGKRWGFQFLWSMPKSIHHTKREAHFCSHHCPRKWSLLFDLMCDGTDLAIGVVLG